MENRKKNTTNSQFNQQTKFKAKHITHNIQKF